MMRTWGLILLLWFCVAFANGQNGCCMPPSFKAELSYFGDTSDVKTYEAQLYYSSDYGVRIDARLWDPRSVLHLRLYVLKSGHYYLFNATSGKCTHSECPGCFQPRCINAVNGWRHISQTLVGIQSVQRWRSTPAVGAYSEVNMVVNNKAQCVPIDELRIKGIYLESETKYDSTFWTNVLPSSIHNPDVFQPPRVCLHLDRSMPLEEHTRVIALPGVLGLTPKY